MANFCSVLDAPGPTMVAWIHGISEENLSKEKENLGICCKKGRMK
jgi:hypothetical protein